MSNDSYDIEWRCGCQHLNPDFDERCNGCQQERYPEEPPCKHQREEVSDMNTSDSDTVFVTYWCPECKTPRTEEVVGSLARAMCFEFQVGGASR